MKKKLLYVVNVDKFFLSHRLNIALEAKSFLNVNLATKFELEEKLFRKKKILTHQIFLQRGSFGIFSNFITMVDIFTKIWKIKPDLIHFISIKPVLIGGIVSKLFPSISKIFSVSGLGSNFINDDFFSKFKYFFLIYLYNHALNQKKSKVIFQNKNDLNFIIKRTKLTKKNCVLIPGSGVSLNTFRPKKLNFHNPVVMFPSRILTHKGIFEFIDAVKILKRKNIKARFVLVGDIDTENPSGVKLSTVKEWEKKNLIENWGYKKNMSKILNSALIVVLPSYREGFPKVLIEAAACGRPSITTNVPGCRDAVINNYTGILIPVKNSIILAKEIEKLLNDKVKIKKMSNNARKYALQNFDVNEVVRKHIKIYKELLLK